jgi:hypothetical protein
MRRLRYLLGAFLCTLFIPATAPHARAETLLTLGNSPVELTGPWRFRTGDSPKVPGSQAPAWAQGDFDASGWQDYVVDSKHRELTAAQAIESEELPGWQQHGHPSYTGYAWYRIRLQVSPGTSHLALLMPQYVNDAYEIYWNGQKIGTFGKLDGVRILYGSRPLVFEIPDDVLRSGQPAILALRFWNLPYEALPSLKDQYGGLRGVPLGGPAELLEIFQKSLRQQMNERLGSSNIVFALYGAVGLISLFLFFFCRGQREYLWTGVSFLAVGSSAAIAILGATSRFPLVLQWTGNSVCGWISISAASLSVMHLLGVPRNLWRRCTYAMSGVLFLGSCAELSLAFGVLPPTAGWDHLADILLNGADLAAALLMIAIAVDGIRRLGRRAWLPMSPGILFIGAVAASFAELFFPQLRHTLDAVQNGCEYGIPVAILVVFLLRFTRQERENAQLNSEMEAARNVQSLLVPVAGASTPGFSVESVYLPASQVGGDFFQAEPANDGSLCLSW